MALIFDSLTTARVLESKGFTSEQAEGIAEQMNQLLVHDIATKGDVAALQVAMQAEFAAVRGEVATIRTEFEGDTHTLRTELKGDIHALRTELKGDIGAVRAEMKAMTSDITVKIYSVGCAVVALVVAAQKLLP